MCTRHFAASLLDLEVLVCAHHSYTLACDMQGICEALQRCKILASNLLDQQLYHELVNVLSKGSGKEELNF